MDANAYSPLWFNTFLGEIDDAIVATEIAFLRRQLPRERFASVLDLCCGTGRHLERLSANGYRVVGVDRDARVLRLLSDVSGASVLRADMAALPLESESMDAVICMWQSFGYLDAAANRAVLAGVARLLRPNGRFVLDVYHRDHYAQSEGERRFERGGVTVTERRSMEGRRLRVVLRYDSAEATTGADEFDWHLYTPAELAAEGASVGLTLALACAAFDEARAPSDRDARMQLVFERGATSVSVHA